MFTTEVSSKINPKFVLGIVIASLSIGAIVLGISWGVRL